MKKSILLLTVFGIIPCAIILSCNSATNSINVQENINEDGIEIDEISQEYLEEIKHYRNVTAKTIESNSQNITDFKSKIDVEKEESKCDYIHSIFELELYNSYMKKKLDDYKPEGKESWEIFKAEYTRQLDELDKKFTDFTKVI